MAHGGLGWPFTALLLLFLTFGGHSIEIYWAVPSHSCLNRTVPPLDPARYGIRTNRDHKFHGSEVVIFYESQLGLYPYIQVEEEEEKVSDDKLTEDEGMGNLVGKFVNGGIPQNVDLRDHLDKAKRDILAAMPDPHFAGPAVIDYEAWRPEWSLNWDSRRIYQLASTRDALSRFPGISEKAAVEIGREMFNKRARKFMVETIRLGRRLRPRALWGFYDTPLCNYDAGERWPRERGCREQFRKHNDKLWWLFAEASALYSSIYLHPRDKKRRPGLCERFIQAKLAEAEWAWSLRRRDRPVVLFTKLELDPYSLPLATAADDDNSGFYTQEDLFCSYDFTAQLGADALIVWSSSKRIRDRCQALARFVADRFGPIVQTLLNRTQECSQRLCNGRGRCVLRARRREPKPWRGGGEPWPRKEFTCLCPREANFYGEYCDLAGANNVVGHSP